jgi:hypothetical protein
MWIEFHKDGPAMSTLWSALLGLADLDAYFLIALLVYRG